MRDLKSISSAWIKETAPNLKLFGWQEGYGLFSVSPGNSESVQRYIAGQAEHHRRTTFEEEYLALLKRAGVEYDP